MPGITVENYEADALLTEEDAQKIAAGSTIEIVLKSEPVSAPPKQAQNLLNKEMERTILLDINLLKMTDGVPERIPTVDSPLTLTFDVPEKYRNETREFFVIRLHEQADGTYSASTLKDLNPEPDKVTIETDRFSVYSLVYKNAQDSSPSTTEHNTEISSTEKNKTTSKQKQTSIGRRNTSSRHTSSKKGTKASTHNSTVSYKDTASTGDQKYDISSLLSLLSGSLICAGMLLTRHLRR